MSIWESSLQITSVCSILGAWFGAFPIPLDWDRPWQVSMYTLIINVQNTNFLEMHATQNCSEAVQVYWT